MVYETSLQEALKIIADYCGIHKNTCHKCSLSHNKLCVLKGIHNSHNVYEGIERIIESLGVTPIIVDTNNEVWPTVLRDELSFSGGKNYD